MKRARIYVKIFLIDFGIYKLYYFKNVKILLIE